MSSPSLVMERSKAVICRNLFNDQSELLRIDRFDLVRTLGSGGMGVVYEAIDPQRDEHVALKMLKERGVGDLYRLKREFRSLAELAHPNLVVLHELSVAPQHAFFTMELVVGQDIVSYIRRGAAPGSPPADEARLCSTLAQLCEGVRALHLAGKLHCDLKPSNVLVTEAGRVVLLDFGLVHDLRDATSPIEGTPAFMAPEQLRGRACESSDWYAVGRVLQEALFGSARPELTERALIRQLAALAERLLLPEPALRPGWREISALVRRDARDGRGPPQMARSRQRFVGRAAELSALERAFEQSRRRPLLMLLRGESGIGKTTLMRQFAGTLASRGEATVLSSRCYEREFLPFKALDGAIDELVPHLAAGPDEPLAGLSAEDRRALVQLFPALGRVRSLAAAGAISDDVHPVVQRGRGFDALKHVFGALAARRPLVVCIDDLQWSDADSGALLAALLCDADAPPLLVIASDRTDPGRLNPAIEELYRAADHAGRPASLLELTLGALPPQDAAQLARNMLQSAGSASLATLARVAAESRGNPLFLRELSRWLTSAPRAPGDRPSVDSIVGSRASALSGGAQQVLHLIAIAGRPLSSATIGQTLGLERDLQRLVLELRRARLVHVVRRAETQLIELDHDRIGEAVLRRLASAQRHELHAQLARALDADGAHAEQSVAQYIAAQLPEEAARRARQAGYLALAALAFARAAWLFRQALELGRWPEATRAHIYAELALALEHAGRGLEAAEAYRQAAACTDERLRAVQLEAQAAAHLMHNGRFTDGSSLFERCFAQLGAHWPRSRLELSISIVAQLALLSLGRPAVRLPAESDELRLVRARLCSEAAQNMEGYDLMRAVHAGLIGMRDAEVLGDPAWRLRARGTRALLRCASVSWGGAQRGLDELAQCCAEAQQLGDPVVLTELQWQLGFSHLIQGDPRSALAWATRCEANLRLLPRPPRALYRVMGLAVNALHDLGEVREAARRWSAYAYEARHHDDVVTSFWTHAHPLQIVSLLAAEDRAGAERHLEQQARQRAKHPRFLLVSWSHAVSRVETELYWERPLTALSLLELEWPAFSQTGYRFLGSLTRMLRLRVMMAAAARLPRGLRRTRLLWLVRIDLRLLGITEHGFMRTALRVLHAAVALLDGRREAARRHLEASLPELDKTHKLSAASVRHCLGLLAPDRARGAELRRVASEVLQSEGIVNHRRWIAWTLPGFGGLIGESHE